MSSFHYDFILSKRSSLAKVWLAAHWEKKLSKVQVFETNLQSSVQDILNSRTPIALRTSSHLLLGLVRIYSRKTKYLLSDCSEALVNIKLEFRPGASVTLEKPKRKRAKDILDCPFLITEKVDLLDQWIPEMSSEMDCSLNQSKIEEITIQEEPIKASSLEEYFDDEGFGDMNESACLDFPEQDLKDCAMALSRVYSFADSGCGVDENYSHDSRSPCDCSDPFSSSLTPANVVHDVEKENKITVEEDQFDLPKFTLESDELEESPEMTRKEEEHVRSLFDLLTENYTATENEVFFLDPLVESPEKLAKTSRKNLKRKLIVDKEILIDRETIFDQLKDPSPLHRIPELAPRTKRRMKQKAAESAESLFLTRPMLRPLAPCLEKLFENLLLQKKSICRTSFDEEMDLSHTNNDQQDLSSVFIPLPDTEYSSDEDDRVEEITHEYTKENGESVQEAKDEEELVPDEILSPTTSNEPTEEIFDQEADISQDEFCSSVESTVLKSCPTPVDFDHIVRNGNAPLTRKNVARKFLKCLIMQRDTRIRLAQDSNFSAISLYPGIKHTQQLELR